MMCIQQYEQFFSWNAAKNMMYTGILYCSRRGWYFEKLRDRVISILLLCFFFRLKVKNNVSMKISWKFLFHRSIGSPLDAYLFYFFLSICWNTKCLNILNNIGALECNKKRITLYISRYLLLVIRRI